MLYYLSPQVVTFFPGILPYSHLGAFGSFLHYLGYNHHTWLVVGLVELQCSTACACGHLLIVEVTL